jgi:DNA replication licensing factor MCM4
VAKAGIVCQLKARASLLVAANPLKSKYDLSKSVVENINLSPALLSRFDLIYVIIDMPSKLYDKKIAHHILSMYSSSDQFISNIPILPNQLLRYISFARDYIQPKISL